MNTSLTTKHGLDDRVYTIEYNGSYFEPSMPMFVNEIRLRITKYGTYIIYHLIDGGLTVDFHETDCYATYEECLAECERLSKERI